MKGLFRYLSPFSPDQSGACAVFFEYGGITVIIDAGGCTGNVCGFDEPRYFIKKSAVYSAGLRDMDAILGRDERLIEKLEDAVNTVDANFIALIGTPVPAVIATDMAGLKKMAEKKYGIPVIGIATNGMDTYEAGEKKAYRALLELKEDPLFKEKIGDNAGYDVCIWGMTPLNIPGLESSTAMRERIAKNTGAKAVTLGMDSDIKDIAGIDKAKIHYCVSPGSYDVVKKLCEATGSEMRTGFAPDDGCTLPFEDRIKGDVLIVHQQILANEIRSLLRRDGYEMRCDAASFFEMIPDLEEDGDAYIRGEKEFIEFVKNGNYGTIICDPLYMRALRDIDIVHIPLPHFAVSGEMYADENPISW